MELTADRTEVLVATFNGHDVEAYYRLVGTVDEPEPYVWGVRVHTPGRWPPFRAVGAAATPKDADRLAREAVVALCRRAFDPKD